LKRVFGAQLCTNGIDLLWPFRSTPRCGRPLRLCLYSGPFPCLSKRADRLFLRSANRLVFAPSCGGSWQAISVIKPSHHNSIALIGCHQYGVAAARSVGRGCKAASIISGRAGGLVERSLPISCRGLLDICCRSRNGRSQSYSSAMSSLEDRLVPFCGRTGDTTCSAQQLNIYELTDRAFLSRRPAFLHHLASSPWRCSSR
jgi:hypothetical protein